MKIFLQVAKHNAQLKRFLVVVLTTSEEQQDKVNSFDLGLAAYSNSSTSDNNDARRLETRRSG